MRKLVIGGVGAGLALGALGLAAAVAGDPAALSGEAGGPGGTLPGLCEASAIVRWEGGFLVGDNETEDKLHAFSPSFAPAPARELGAVVEDVEALTIVDGQLLVVGSQSASKKGKHKPDRERVLLLGKAPVRPDLSLCTECEAVRTKPPKEGGLSVEGAATWAGGLWLGLRSPNPGGDALLLRMDGDPAMGLRAAERLPLDLDGLGVRDMVTHEGALLVLAGPVDGTEAAHRLYRVDTPGAAPTRLGIELPAGAEGVVVDGAELVVVTDGDGEPGKPCKRPATWVRLPMPGGSGA